MPRGHNRLGPPHITRAKSSFNALDMFKQLITFTTPVAPGADNRISSAGDNRISSAGDNRISKA